MSRKTFGAVRVRGPIQADESLTVRGCPVAPVREYVAVISQADDDEPDVTEVLNTLGVAVVVSVDGTGKLDFSAAGVFTEGRTVAAAEQAGGGNEVFVFRARVMSDSTVRVYKYDMTGGNVGSILCAVRITVFQ